MRRGIFGGTFDPPHLAHLMAAEAAYRALELDVVTFLPAGAPWQKADRDVTSAEDRLEMTRLAIEGVAYFEVDDREIRRDGWTYTIDSVEELAVDAELTLILGADAARSLRSWHRADELLERVELAVVPRPGVGPAEVEAELGRGFAWVDLPHIDVSGRIVRARAAEGKSIRFMVPEAVFAFIEERRLYG